LNFKIGSVEYGFHTKSLLSLPPEQSCWSSNDHFSPQIYCLCPINLLMKGLLVLRSLWRIVLSRDPVLKMDEFQAIAPTLLVWPGKILTLFILLTSQIWTYPLFVPKANMGPFNDQATEVALSEVPKSHNFVTLEFPAFHMYTLEAKPTAR
jgi:hypothetical protein